MATFPDKLKELRKEKGITLDKMAEDLGTTKSTLSRYENGKREPKMFLIKEIASYFNVSTDYLLGRTDQRQPRNEKADKIKQALSDDPELMEFWEQLSTREDLKLMFKQTKDLDPESIHRIIEIVKIIEDEERERYGG